MRAMASVEEALEQVRVAAGAPRLAVEHVALADALGRVLAADVRMDHDVPPFRRAAMDGFAVADAAPPGARYAVVGSVMAGEAGTRAVGPGEALRVMTGATVPPGTARVVPFEWTAEEGASVEVRRRPVEDPHVVEAGAHVRAGTVVLHAGLRLGPGALGVLATAGVVRVPVARRPRVAVLGTGSELVDVGARPGPAQIRGSNNAVLVAQARRAGGEVEDLGLVGDDAEPLRAALERGLAHDVLLVSGGVSRGDRDLVPGALGALGVRPVFHGWSVQPGGPLWFGVRGATLVFALPGNPAASFVGFEVLGVPALAMRLGRPFESRRALHAVWEGADPGSHPRRRFRPVHLSTDASGSLSARPIPWKGSGDPFALADAEGLAMLPEAGFVAVPRAAVSVIPLGTPW